MNESIHYCYLYIVKAHATDGRVTDIVHAASGKVADTVGNKAAGKRPIV